MKTVLTWIVAASILASTAFIACGGETEIQSSNGWDPKLFAYDPPAELIVEVKTPNAAQISLWPRPPAEAADAPEPTPTAGKVTPAALGRMNVWHLRFKDAAGKIVPALLCEPRQGKGPWPVVIAVHGLTSNKAQVCWQLENPLAAHGFAVLAPDLPCHGERAGDPRSMVDPRQQFALWRDSVIDVHQLIDYAGTRSELDTRGGIALVGYSLGSWISSIAGPSDRRVSAMVLMVGGAWDLPPFLTMDPQVAATDPRLALPNFAGRPVLLLNGKQDTIVRPDMGRRLFAAAAEPKKQIWYDSGHLLPADAYEKAAKWLGELRQKKRTEGSTDSARRDAQS